VYPGTSAAMRAALVVALVVAAGCGEQERPAATPQPTPEPTATPGAAASAQECFELWNEHEDPGTAGQTAPADVLADLAPTPVLVEFVSGECHVIAPVRKGRAYVWVARGGRAPYGHAVPQDVPQLEYNARGLKSGKLEPLTK
jgi:hypothetical protein